jgi:hypothetical protein
MNLMNRLLIFIIVVLMAIILFQQNGCTYIHDKQPEVVTVHDTTWQVHDSLIIKKLKIKETIHDTVSTPPEYIADTNYSKLKAQYDALVIAYLAKNIYADTLKLDTLGYVTIADTIQKNNLQNRSYKYNYKIPTIHTTTTITKYAPLKNQLYIGGGVDGNKTVGVINLSAGLLLKTKKDNIYSVTVGSNVEGQINYGFRTFWKLKK